MSLLKDFLTTLEINTLPQIQKPIDQFLSALQSNPSVSEMAAASLAFQGNVLAALPQVEAADVSAVAKLTQNYIDTHLANVAASAGTSTGTTSTGTGSGSAAPSAGAN